MMETTTPTNRRTFATLSLGALGVVFGDIGTSPLYTIQSTFGDPHAAIAPNAGNILGVLSVMFWMLVLIVSLKYVVFIMRADNNGEGGIMALMALAQRCARGNAHLRWGIMILGLLGASLFYGDGVITPAISVL
jgi:KUP system potassium uptake protein